MDRTVALALAVVIGACAAPTASRPLSALDRAHAADAALACDGEFSLDGRLSDHITDPPTTIRQRGTSGARFRLVRALYAVDKSLIFAKRFDEVRPPGETLEVFEGRLRPGAHVLTVVLEFEGNERGRFADAAEYRVTVRASRAFALGEGELGDITVRTREPEAAAQAPGSIRPAPTIAFEVGFKSAR